MSQLRLFSIIGDPNVRRNMTGLNMASREVMKSAEVIDCCKLTSLNTALAQVRQESTVLIVAAVTEFILSSGDCGSITSSIDPVLDAFRAKIFEFCAFRPTLQVLDLDHSTFHYCTMTEFIR